MKRISFDELSKLLKLWNSFYTLSLNKHVLRIYRRFFALSQQNFICWKIKHDERYTLYTNIYFLWIIKPTQKKISSTFRFFHGGRERMRGRLSFFLRNISIYVFTGWPSYMCANSLSHHFINKPNSIFFC